MGNRARGFTVLLTVAIAACAAGIITGPVPTGTWGGEQGNLAVFADSATLDLPCAVGRIPHPLVTDSAGRFDLSGFWAPQAGPIGIGGANWQPAHFRGLRTDDHIKLLVELQTNTIGPLLFTRDVVVPFPRCL